jgi:hypothetical protein
MALDPSAVRTWAHDARAAFEIAPLFELERGQRVQLGFELDLYARIAGGLAASEGEISALWDRLREVAESLVGVLGADGRVEIAPFDMADRLRPETDFVPEVLLQARLYHGAEHVAAAPESGSGRIAPLEARLRELGLRPRSW